MNFFASPWQRAVCFHVVAFVLAVFPTHGQPPEWTQRTGYREAKLSVPAGGKTGFALLGAEQTGIHWTNHLPIDRVAERQNLMNGSGLAAGDFDGDGRCDLFFCQKAGASALYRNLGNWKFEDVTERAGVACTNQSSTGAVFADINGDGRLDLLVNSFTGPGACFLNLGQGRFTNVTQNAGLISKGGATSQALADVDGDGDLDLYVAYFGIEAILRDGGAYSTRLVGGRPVVTGRYARRLKILDGLIYEYGDPDLLLLNDGQAHFTPVAWENMFRDEDGRPMSTPPDFGLAVQVRDINGDGRPDIYVCNDFQTPDRVWLNDGAGHFQAIDRRAVRNMSYASMGVDFGDLDRDGRLDFITVEMLSREHAHHLRQSSPMRPKLRQPGQIDDREEVARNAFYWNRGDGTYAEIAYYAGVAASDWSWTPICLDVDLDGYEDLLISNGHLLDVNDRDVSSALASAQKQTMAANRSVLLRYPRLDTPNAAFRNRGDLTFEDIGDQWAFNSRELSHGMALADLDNDGDLDVVINCLNAPPLIYRNDSVAPRVAVRLKGKAPNVFGIGAMIEVSGGSVPVQAQEMLCGARYLSGDDTVRTFAAGGATNRLSIQVTWRNGTQSLVADAEPNRLYEIDETNASRLAPRASRPAPSSPWFEDVSALLGHKHLEQAYDDFQRQPLLAKKYSQLGPAVAWCDLDGDGHEDLIIGSGKGGKLAVYRNTGVGRFEPWPDTAWDKPASDDQTGIVAARLAGGKAAAFVGTSSYETSEAPAPAIAMFVFDGRKVSGETNAVIGSAFRVPGSELQTQNREPGTRNSTALSPGPLALADLDGDGALELFVGGRIIPGRYPEPASSRLLRLTNGALSLDAANTAALEKVGLVSGAVFSDLNGDGLPELILACEWGPLRIFRNVQGRLQAWDPMVEDRSESGQGRKGEREKGSGAEVSPAPRLPFSPAGFLPCALSRLTGLWSSVATGDFDGDGRLDIVAGNWGLNSFYNQAPAGPWLMYYGDFNGDGRVGLLEAYYDPTLKKTVPWRDLALVGQAIPWARERFATHKAFAEASVTDILGERMAKTTELKAVTMASVVLLNHGDRFEVVSLPMQAQWAPVMGLNVDDADGDGKEDIFLAQNFFAVRPDDDRLDAGRGLWLRGDGTGRFSAVPGQESGVKVYGEQRASALCDFDRDGRTDLVVTQNGAETRLYRNTIARPGLRVKLELAGGADAIGAQLRLVFGQRLGPVREVRAGSGYWSQDSVVQVLSTPAPPTQLWVRWPGGKTTTSPLPENAREIVVAPDGKVTVRR